MAEQNEPEQAGQEQGPQPKRRRGGKGSRPRQIGQKPWREDPEILARLPIVEERYLRGVPRATIAAELGVSRGTVDGDIHRCRELWLEATSNQIEASRGEAIARLGAARDWLLQVAAFDHGSAMAVATGDASWIPLEERPEPTPEILELPWRPRHTMQLLVDQFGRPAMGYRPNAVAAINGAVAAIMHAAKLQGLIVDKLAPTDPGGRMTWAELLEMSQRAQVPDQPAVPVPDWGRVLGPSDGDD